MKFDKKDLEKAVKETYTMADCMRALDTDKNKTHYRTMWKYITNLDLDTSHWEGRLHTRKGIYRPKQPTEQILVENSSYSSGSFLRKRLIREGLLEEKCAICNITDWLENPLAFHLDHINGINTDNRLENLRILCPNCHSQTDTYCAKNKTTFVKRDRAKKKYETYYLCAGCKKKKASRKDRHCWECWASIPGLKKKKSTIQWPPFDEMTKMIQETSWSETARKIGCCDNAIRKHYKKSGLSLPISLPQQKRK